MGKRIITNNKDSWQYYSTNSDSVIAEFNNEVDLKKHIALEIIYDGKLKAIQELMTFPNGWNINDEYVPTNRNTKALDDYYSWYKEICRDSDTYEKYYKAIDEKLNKLFS